MSEIVLILLFGPMLTVIASKTLLPNLSILARLSLALPQVILFCVGAILRAKFGLFSRWEYLMWFSVFAGPAIGFWLASMITKYQIRQTIGNA